MGRREFEVTDERKPVTPQAPEELVLARKLHSAIDVLLGERNSRSFNFVGKWPVKAEDHAVEVDLFGSDRWPLLTG